MSTRAPVNSVRHPRRGRSRAGAALPMKAPMLLLMALAVATAHFTPAISSAEDSPTARISMPSSPVPHESASVEHVLLLIQRFEQAATQYRIDLDRAGEHRFHEQRMRVEDMFDRQIDRLLRREQRRREEAIVLFENFVERHPTHPVYTPDALFRLAELYFEDANDRYLLALESWERQLQEYYAGRLAHIPDEPSQDYSRTIRSFRRLINNFPDYRLVEGAYYLLGYSLTNMGMPEEGKDSLLALVQRFPETDFAPEAWMRIGEYYFDYNQLPDAIHAYQQVVEQGDSAYYDRAIYKLAWTYYRLDQFHLAIQHFRDLILLTEAEAQEDGRATAADLREESIQYIAVCIAEEDWAGDGMPDEVTPLDRMKHYLKGEYAFEAEVIRRLADIFFDNTMYSRSAVAYGYLMDLYPLLPENPEVHERIILSHERGRRIEEAVSQRVAASREYLPGAPWYEYNRENEEALDKAAEVAEISLITVAIYYHNLAQSLREEARTLQDRAAEEDAQLAYYRAAEFYNEYINRYPESDNLYELNFFYADALYFSGRHLEAAIQYKRVRDMEVDEPEYLHEAALSTILAYEHHVNHLVRRGDLPPQASTDYTGDVEDHDGELPPPMDIPDLVESLVAARDWYVHNDMESPDEPDLQSLVAFRAAEVLYNFNHVDEARRRFALIVDQYPDNEAAALAAGNIVETYRIEQDWEKMAEWAARIVQLDLGTAEERRELREEVTLLQVGALFKQAEDIYAQGRLEEAAEAYVILVDNNPGNAYVDKALNNAAVAYEKLGHFDAAMRLYERIWRQYPDSPTAQRALYLSAVNSERFFEFDRAIEYYLLYTKKYPESENYAFSLYRAALLQEDNMYYADAARNYERYAREFPDRGDAWRIAYRVATVHEKDGNIPEMERVLNWFINDFGAKPEASPLVLEALDKMADNAVARGDRRRAQELYRRVLDEYERRDLQPATASAQIAAKARFMQIEEEFHAFENLQLSGSLEQQARILGQLQEVSVDLQSKYASVFDYRSIHWTIAANYRTAHILQLFANKLYDAPVPAIIADDPEAADMYRMQLEDLALPIEDQAMALFERTLQAARDNRIVNEWSQRSLAMLNRFNPTQYPLFREEKRAIVPGSIYGLPPITSHEAREVTPDGSDAPPGWSPEGSPLPPGEALEIPEEDDTPRASLPSREGDYRRGGWS